LVEREYYNNRLVCNSQIVMYMIHVPIATPRER